MQQVSLSNHSLKVTDSKCNSGILSTEFSPGLHFFRVLLFHCLSKSMHADCKLIGQLKPCVAVCPYVASSRLSSTRPNKWVSSSRKWLFSWKRKMWLVKMWIESVVEGSWGMRVSQLQYFLQLCDGVFWREMSGISPNAQGQQFLPGTALLCSPGWAVLIVDAELAFNITFSHLKWWLLISQPGQMLDWGIAAEGDTDQPQRVNELIIPM